MWIQREKLDRIEEAMAHIMPERRGGAARCGGNVTKFSTESCRKQQKETEMEGHDRKLDSP